MKAGAGRNIVSGEAQSCPNCSTWLVGGNWRWGQVTERFDCQAKEFGCYLINRMGSFMRLKGSEPGKNQMRPELKERQWVRKGQGALRK